MKEANTTITAQRQRIAIFGLAKLENFEEFENSEIGSSYLVVNKFN